MRTPSRDDLPLATIYVASLFVTAFDRCTVLPIPARIQSQTILFEQAPSEVWRMIRGLCAAFVAAKRAGLVQDLVVRLGDCSPRPCLKPRDVDELRRTAADVGIASLSYEFFNENLFTARGHNVLADCSDADALLILNPDTYPSPTLVSGLVEALREPGVGIAEARQLPLEHPKAYDPSTGDTCWASTCCLLVPRLAVFEPIGGFDPEYFRLYCDDVDFSWRARLAGWRVVHVPRAVVFHDKRPSDAGVPDTSSVELFEGMLARLMLAERYGRPDIRDETLRFVEVHGFPEHRRAVNEYRLREAAGKLPSALVGAEKVAQFVRGEYAEHRF